MTRRFRTLTALTAATALAACNFAPKYVRPVGAVPAELRGAVTQSVLRREAIMWWAER